MRLVDHHGGALELQPRDGPHALDLAVEEADELGKARAEFRLAPMDALALGAVLVEWALDRIEKEGP